ncbi:MAG: Gx transporter family protein [Desulfomonile sp.]|jgi:heptaprenyl diphosphate synthase|nr:Gx transporter family protein [Deltaproteobacteria bacterium]
MEQIRRLSRLALLLALAVVIHTAETFLPFTVVWFRFGFANIIGLATLYLFGFKDALFITLGRIFLGSLATGLFGSPAFVLSLSGGTSAILAMGLLHRYFSKTFSEIGVSLAGAVCHNAAQLAAAYLILLRNEAILLMLPLMILTATVTGFINGMAAKFFIRHVKKLDTRQPN